MTTTQETLYELRGELYRHQTEALEWMNSIESAPQHGMVGGILSLTQGLGKTLTALTQIVRKYNETPQESRRPSLVIVKKAVIPEWNRCIRQFYPELLPDTVFFHADYMGRGSIDAMTKDFLLRKAVVITTYQTLMYRGYKDAIDCCLEYGDDNTRFRRKVMAVHCRKLSQCNRVVTGKRTLHYTPWRYVFADESQVFANPRTATYRAVMGVYGENKWCLTGTPIRNSDNDLFAQLQWCGMSSALAKTPKEWRQFVNYGRYESYDFNRFIRSVDYESAGIELPEKVRHVIPIDFGSNEEALMYEQIREKTIEALRSASISKFVTYAHVLALFTRLRQTCVAAHAITPQSKRDNRECTDAFKGDAEMAQWCLDKDSTAGTASSKLQKVVEIVGDIPDGEKVVIFSNFVALMDLAETAVILELDCPTFMLEGGLSVEQRDRQLDAFKAHDGTAVLFVNYKVGAEGLNITEANHVICLEPWWNYATHAQAESRCWRIGQTKKVHVYDILIRNSIESRILEICARKRHTAERFLGQSDTLVADSTRLSLDMIGRLLA